MNERVVETVGVAHQAMFPDVLSVITRDNEHGMVEYPTLAELLYQYADFCVNGGECRIVAGAQDEEIFFRHRHLLGKVVQVMAVDALGLIESNASRQPAGGELWRGHVGEMHVPENAIEKKWFAGAGK